MDMERFASKLFRYTGYRDIFLTEIIKTGMNVLPRGKSVEELKTGSLSRKWL